MIPGAVVFITTRTHDRELRFTATLAVTVIFRFLLAIYATKYGMVLYGVLLEGSHYHLLVGDPHGNEVRFRKTFHSVLARAINALQGRRDHVFSGAEPSVVRVLTKEDFMFRLVYLYTNPVKDLLVRTVAEYPGFHTYGMRIGPHEVSKPSYLFNGQSGQPDSATLTIAKGECYDDLSNEEYLEEIARRVTFKQRELQMKARQEGRTYLGVAKLRKTRHTDRPKSFEPLRGRRARTVSNFAKVRRYQHSQRSRFLRPYGQMLKELRRRAGGSSRPRRRMVFPAGTYKLWVDGVVDRAATPKLSAKLPTYKEWLAMHGDGLPTSPRDG